MAFRRSSSLFSMLGVNPQAGRVFTAEDDLAGRPASALLAHGIWSRRFGRDTNAVGRSMILNGQTYQIALRLHKGENLYDG